MRIDGLNSKGYYPQLSKKGFLKESVVYSRHVAKEMYQDCGYKHLYEKHHDCCEDPWFYCTSTLCDKGKTNRHAVNYKERDLYQVENGKMSCMDINVNYDKLRDFYDEQNKIDIELKIDSFTTLIRLPLVENYLNGMYVYVTEIHTDFSTRTTPLTIQDPVWVNYDLDACQVRLDQPLLFDITDIQQVHWHWKRIAALKNLSSIMCNYLNDKGEKSESHYFMDMRYLLTDLQRHYSSKCDNDGSTSFMNFITSTLTICINQAFNSLGINNNNNNVSKFEGCAHHLDDDSRNETLDDELDSFRPLSYPGITHLLSCLNMIHSCQRGGYVHDQLGEKKVYKQHMTSSPWILENYSQKTLEISVLQC